MAMCYVREVAELESFREIASVAPSGRISHQEEGRMAFALPDLPGH